MTCEDILLKPARIGQEVPVHQDLALQSVSGGVVSLGIHLDDATDNPIHFLPGSHKLGPLTRDQVRAHRQKGGFQAFRPQAGDVLVHNALTVHYSEANTAPTSRCTWYLEFRTRPALRSESPWDETWINQRRSMLFRAAAERERAGDEARWPPLATGESREQWCRDTSALRTPHVTGDIDYDLESPYHHFA